MMLRIKRLERERDYSFLPILEPQSSLWSPFVGPSICYLNRNVWTLSLLPRTLQKCSSFIASTLSNVNPSRFASGLNPGCQNRLQQCHISFFRSDACKSSCNHERNMSYLTCEIMYCALQCISLKVIFWKLCSMWCKRPFIADKTVWAAVRGVCKLRAVSLYFIEY
jgi:hypothetical protein